MQHESGHHSATGGVDKARGGWNFFEEDPSASNQSPPIIGNNQPFLLESSSISRGVSRITSCTCRTTSTFCRFTSECSSSHGNQDRSLFLCANDPARLATNAYVRLRYQQVSVPDPTEKLVGSIRNFVEGNGAKLLVGIQHRDDALVRYLEASRIAFAKLEGADFYSGGGWGEHWTPEGHKLVAERILALLSANGIVHSGSAADKNN